jgi:hypothetical protein
MCEGGGRGDHCALTLASGSAKIPPVSRARPAQWPSALRRWTAKPSKSWRAASGLGIAQKSIEDALTMPNFASPAAFVDLETELFAPDASTSSLRSVAFAANGPPRSPRPASLRPLPFLPRPPEWRRFPRGIGCEAVLVRSRHATTNTAIAQAA